MPLKKLIRWTACLICLVCVLSAVDIGTLYVTLPNVQKIKKCLTTTMNHVFLCAKSERYVRLDDVSPNFLTAVVLSEDASFYSHHGIDWYEVKESFLTDLAEHRLARGGSTITQQLARNVFLDDDKSFFRKIREVFLAFQLEDLLTKHEILEKYINVIELGPKLYGVKSATSYYFHKAPRDLNLLEAVYLVQLLPNPKTYSRTFKMGRLTSSTKDRMEILLRRLYRFNRIGNMQLQTALSLLERFPWSDLTPAEIAKLNGQLPPLVQHEPSGLVN